MLIIAQIFSKCFSFYFCVLKPIRLNETSSRGYTEAELLVNIHFIFFCTVRVK